ncbi:sodium:proton exchanger, partial [Euryarchaeota archaeon ex4484_178]
MKKLAAVAYLAIMLISIPLYLFMLSNLTSLPILVILFIIGIYLLVKGSDYFVEGAASIATHRKVSQHTIGLTLVALATSLPEFAVSTIASFSHHPSTAWGNVVGSNIANIGLVLGTAVVLMPLSLSKHIRKDVGVLVVITAILFFLSILFMQILWWMGVLFI